jgi:hypothetical protein
MRRMLLTAVAIVAFISSAVLLHHAAARAHMPPGTDAKAADTGLLQLATNLCGNNGCVAVQVKRLDKHQLQKPASKSLQQYMLPRTTS